MKGVRSRKEKTGHQKIVNAWYEYRFFIPKPDLQPENVIDIPDINDAATISCGSS